MTTPDRTARLAAIAEGLFGANLRDTLWLLHELSQSDERLKQCAGLLRTAAIGLERSMWIMDTSVAPGSKCRGCKALAADYSTLPPHTPDCLVTKLRTAADEAEGKGNG